MKLTHTTIHWDATRDTRWGPIQNEGSATFKYYEGLSEYAELVRRERRSNKHYKAPEPAYVEDSTLHLYI